MTSIPQFDRLLSTQRHCFCAKIFLIRFLTPTTSTMGNKPGQLTKEQTNQLASKTHFGVDEIQSLSKAFKTVDKDKSGDLDIDEFSTLIKSQLKTDMSDESIKALFNTFDEDGSGKIEFKELATGLSLVAKGTPVEKLTILFKAYDRDDSGELDMNEVKAVMDQMRVVAKGLGRDPEKTEDFVQAITKKLDADGSGQISLQEWLEIGQKTPSLLVLLGASGF